MVAERGRGRRRSKKYGVSHIKTDSNGRLRMNESNRDKARANVRWTVQQNCTHKVITNQSVNGHVNHRLVDSNVPGLSVYLSRAPSRGLYCDHPYSDPYPALHPGPCACPYHLLCAPSAAAT